MKDPGWVEQPIKTFGLTRLITVRRSILSWIANSSSPLAYGF